MKGLALECFGRYAPDSRRKLDDMYDRSRVRCADGDWCKAIRGQLERRSRLATVEALADHGTFAIDDSIFCRPPADKLVYGTQQANFISSALTTSSLSKDVTTPTNPLCVHASRGLYRLLQFLGFRRSLNDPMSFVGR